MTTRSEDERAEQKLRELVERAGAGDSEAIGELYRRYQRRLIAVAHARLGPTLHNLSESVDLVQSVWADLLDDLEEFQYEGEGSFYAWLRTCLVHKIDAKRRYHHRDKRDAQRLRAVEQPEVLPDRGRVPGPGRAAMAAEARLQLLDLLDRFPEPQRTVLVRRLRDEESYAAIGARIERSAEATKKLYLRGIERLIDLLPGDWKAG